MKVVRDRKLTRKRARSYERGTNQEMRQALNKALKRLGAPEPDFHNRKQKEKGGKT